MQFIHYFAPILSAFAALAQDGVFVDLGSHKLYLSCSGPVDARPVVVFEAGGGGTSAVWKGVQSILPPSIRACAYDRAGLGKSDAGPQPRSMEAEVAELHALLAKAKIAGPIVLAGHSLGGILARLFVQKYPDSVAAVLLVDPTEEDDLVFNTKVNRWIAVRDLDDSLGEGARAIAAFRKANSQPFRGRPLTVIGAGKRLQPPGTTAEWWEETRKGRDGRVKALSELSKNSTFILDADSGHNIPQQNPKIVAAAIEELIRKVAEGGAARP